ncbi:MAG: AHH domain-containing protein, partial [Archangium sp.]
MSPRPVGPYPAEARQRPWVRGCALFLLVLFSSACATGAPPGSMLAGGWRLSSRPPPPTPRASAPVFPDTGAATVYEMEVLEPGTVATRPVPVDKAAFQRTLLRLVREVQLGGKSPRQAARELLQAQVEQQGVEHLEAAGEWLAEVNRGRVLTLVPVDDKGPLTPQADAALRAKYEDWCKPWDGGDCLGLFEDGPYLRADDRCTLALALAFGSVL